MYTQYTLLLKNLLAVTNEHHNHQQLGCSPGESFLADADNLGCDLKTQWLGDLPSLEHKAVHPECCGLGRGKCIHRMKKSDAVKILANPSKKIKPETLEKLKKISGGQSGGGGGEPPKPPKNSGDEGNNKPLKWSKPELKTETGEPMFLSGGDGAQYLEVTSGDYAIRSYLQEAVTTVSGAHLAGGGEVTHEDGVDEQKAAERIEQVKKAVQASFDAGSQADLEKLGKRIAFITGGVESDWGPEMAAGSDPDKGIVALKPELYEDPKGSAIKIGAVFDSPIVDSVTHEIGHQITPGIRTGNLSAGKSTQGLPDLRNVPGQTKYGQKSVDEAYAESYMRYRHSSEPELPAEIMAVASKDGWAPRKVSVKSLYMTNIETKSEKTRSTGTRCANSDPEALKRLFPRLRDEDVEPLSEEEATDAKDVDTVEAEIVPAKVAKK